MTAWIVDADSGERLRPATPRELECWRRVRENGYSYFFVEDPRDPAEEVGVRVEEG